MRILFTGATSLAGAAWFQWLVREGHSVTAASRRPPANVPSCSVDLSADGAEGLLPDQQFDALVHFASYVPADEKTSTWDECAPANVDGTIRLLRWAEGRVGRVVFASSCAIYGSEKLYTPTDERHPLLPDTNYGLSKYAQEQLVHAFCVSRGIPWVSLRLGYVYGPGMPGGRGIVKLLQIVRSGQPVTLTNATTAGLHLIHVNDIARIGSHLLRQGYGVYNVSGGRHVSLLDYVNAAMEVTERRCEVTERNLPHARVSNWYSIDRLLREGVEPQVSLREGIESMLEVA